MAIDSQRGLGVIILTAQHGETEEKASDPGARDYIGEPGKTRSPIARVGPLLQHVRC